MLHISNINSTKLNLPSLCLITHYNSTMATTDLIDCNDLERVIASLPVLLVERPCVLRSLSTLRFSLSPSTDIRAMGLNLLLLLLLLVWVIVGRCSIDEVLLGSIWNREREGGGRGRGEVR